MLIFWTLTVDCIDFQLFTMCTFTEVYRKVHSDSILSLVYGLTSEVAAVTIKSMGVTPPCTEVCSYTTISVVCITICMYSETSK